jgi:alanine racemase
MNFIRGFFKVGFYQPLNLIEVSKDNLLHNLKVLSKINPKVKIAPVLKSNAYGHGLTIVAKALDQIKAPFFCVDSLYEAYELLKAKIKTPILIMGYVNPENLKVKKLPFSYAVSTLDVAEAISKYQPQAGVHIFVDTGMHREGIPLKELPNFLEKLPKKIKVEGLMSHLASGEMPNDSQTLLQIKNFQKAYEIVRTFGFNPKWIHLSNSGGALNNLNPSCNLARVGLAVYGISPVIPANSGIQKTKKAWIPDQVRDDKLLKPTLTFKSKLIQVKKIGKGEYVGYNSTHQTKVPTVVGILPLGYYDGVDRRLSNKGLVIIDGIECPIIGKVSMNITALIFLKLKIPKLVRKWWFFLITPKLKTQSKMQLKFVMLYLMSC